MTEEATRDGGAEIQEAAHSAVTSNSCTMNSCFDRGRVDAAHRSS